MGPKSGPLPPLSVRLRKTNLRRASAAGRPRDLLPPRESEPGRDVPGVVSGPLVDKCDALCIAYVGTMVAIRQSLSLENQIEKIAKVLDTNECKGILASFRLLVDPKGGVSDIMRMNAVVRASDSRPASLRMLRASGSETYGPLGCIYTGYIPFWLLGFRVK